MRRTVNAITLAAMHLLLAFVTVAWLAPATPAHAEQIEAPDRSVDTMRVSYVEPMRGHLYVELNDGSTWTLRPCRFEDGRHCYWDAGTRGNNRGRSFVVVRGTAIYTRLI